MHSMFILTVWYSICHQSSQALSQLTHTCKLNKRKIIHHTLKFPSLLCDRPRLAKPAPLDDTSHPHHQQLRGCERKLCLIPNCQEFTNKCFNLTADNTERNLLTGKKKKSILSHTGGTVIPQGCEAPALSAGVKKLVKVARSPGLHLGGNSHCPWC